MTTWRRQVMQRARRDDTDLRHPTSIPLWILRVQAYHDV